MNKATGSNKGDRSSNLKAGNLMTKEGLINKGHSHKEDRNNNGHPNSNLSREIIQGRGSNPLTGRSVGKDPRNRVGKARGEINGGLKIVDHKDRPITLTIHPNQMAKPGGAK